MAEDGAAAARMSELVAMYLEGDSDGARSALAGVDRDELVMTALMLASTTAMLVLAGGAPSREAADTWRVGTAGLEEANRSAAFARRSAWASIPPWAAADASRANRVAGYAIDAYAVGADTEAAWLLNSLDADESRQAAAGTIRHLVEVIVAGDRGTVAAERVRKWLSAVEARR